MKALLVIALLQQTTNASIINMNPFCKRVIVVHNARLCFGKVQRGAIFRIRFETETSHPLDLTREHHDFERTTVSSELHESCHPFRGNATFSVPLDRPIASTIPLLVEYSCYSVA